MIVYCVFV